MKMEHDKAVEIPSIRHSRDQSHAKTPLDGPSDHVIVNVDAVRIESEAIAHRNKTKSHVKGNFDGRFEDEHTPDDDHTKPDHLSSPTSKQASMTSPSDENPMQDEGHATQQRQDEVFVQKFWTAYDEILILSLFTQVGIICRLAAAYFFRYFDNVFHSDSALFTVLPLNCLSCFVMGLLCSGESLMQIISTRFTPPRLQHDLYREATTQLQGFQEEEIEYESHYDFDEIDNGDLEIYDNDHIRSNKSTQRGMRQRRQRLKPNKNNGPTTIIRSSSLSRQQHLQQPQNPEMFDDLKEVQLMAWERRIRASVCLLLFPVKQEDVDIVENYFDEGYHKERNYSLNKGRQEEKIEDAEDMTNENGQARTGGFDDLVLEESTDNFQRGPESTIKELAPMQLISPLSPSAKHASSEVIERKTHATQNTQSYSNQYDDGENNFAHDTRENPELDQIISNMASGVSNKISFISRVNLANGWDVGTSPQEKSEDLTLGLRDGLCGALSSFSSWISSMVNLFRQGQIGKAFVGLMLGIQLPIIAYRFGQHVSIYIFVWRCRREKKQDERRGYGIQLHTSDESISNDDFIQSPCGQSDDCADESHTSNLQKMKRTKGRRTVHDEESDVPSIRAIFTALFITCLVAQLTSLTFFKDPDDRLLAMSLLFSPLGVLARWRMMKINSWRPNFPFGTFACNVTACALSGTLGSLLAGKPGPRERIALVSIIAGFGGTLSSVARFIVEILSLVDPILFRLDGFYYAVISVSTGLLFSFLFAASVDWADSVE